MTGFEPPTLKIVDLSGIRTRIVGVEDEHADHLTTPTANGTFKVSLSLCGQSYENFTIVIYESIVNVSNLLVIRNVES